MRYVLQVNGRTAAVDVDPQTPLLTVLQNDLALTGPKFRVWARTVRACTVLVHPLQLAFVDTQAVQCGNCIGGMVMSAKALLDRNPRPTDAEIRQALAGNLCRCCAHLEILSAVHRAATGAPIAGTTVVRDERYA